MSENGYRFKTFSGVFLPSILTIIGVVLFMRLGTVVGTLGISGALGVLFLAESIAIATGFSISAISTNTEVEGGGPYFLISRSLGPGFGSALGLTYFISQSFSVPFYILGFSEAVIKCFPALAEHAMLVSLIPLTILAIISLIGADWAIKTQYVIFAALVLSIIAIFVGGFAQHPSLAGLAANWEAKSGLRVDILVFAANFAIFFPAVTGFLAGVNMSGDLENPRKSIPLGTMSAIFTGLILYAAVIFLVGSAYARESLIADAYRTLYDGAAFHTGPLIVLGVIAATLSSALGTIVGAPRILQAFAADKIFPSLNVFSYGRGKTKDPVPAMLLTFLIALATIWWGIRAAQSSGGNVLNAVAELVTMFTLSTYAIINVAAAVEDFAANPSFRPQFRRYHWGVGIYGAAASLIVAIFINATLMLVAFVVIGAIFFIARHRTLHATFGDARRGYYFEHIRRALVHLSMIPEDAKNWRPKIFTLVGDEAKHLELIRYASLLNNNRGILTVGHIALPEDNGSILPKIVSPGGSLGEQDVPEILSALGAAMDRRHSVLQKLEDFSQKSGILFFPTVVAAPDERCFSIALSMLLQSRDYGPLTPNIVLSGWPSRPERVNAFFCRMQLLSFRKINNLVFSNLGNRSLSEGETIDVWWRGYRNGTLMLILAYLLHCNWDLREKPIRLMRLVSRQDAVGAKDELLQLMNDARIPAIPVVIASDEGFHAVFRQYSRSAAVTFVGIPTLSEEKFPASFATMDALLKEMPPTFLISSAGDTDIQS